MKAGKGEAIGTKRRIVGAQREQLGTRRKS
jgi:hypothetical protein